jgi:ribosomal protein S12 methylthiotransferase accessory factor YcaO
MPSPALPRAQKQSAQTLPPQLLEELFTLKPGDATLAHAYGEEYIIAVMKDVVPGSKPDVKGPKFAALSERVEESVQNEIVQQYLEALEKKYPVRVKDAAVAAAIQ